MNLSYNTVWHFNQGNEKAFQIIFDHFYPNLLFFTQKLTGRKEEAEDILLPIFQKLFERRFSFETEARIKAFLYIAARNSCLNYLRTQKRYRLRQMEYTRQMGNSPFTQYEYETDKLFETVNAVIEKLPVQRRQIFKLIYFEKLKPAEVAMQLRIAERTVYNQTTKAIKTLRLELIEN